MIDTTQISEHMEVRGNDGVHVGTVDHLQGENQIKLTKNDPSSGGQHHFIDLEDVESVSEGALVLKYSSEEAKGMWATP